MQKIACPADVGRKLYHDIWSTAASYFYDRERLQNWNSWKNRFDGEIVDQASAIACARQMLSSLGDRHTVIETDSEETEAQEPEQRSVFCDLTNDNIGVIRILNFDSTYISQELGLALTKIEGCRAFMLDLRNNGGGIIEQSLECSEFFIEAGPIATIERTVDGGVRRDVRFLEPEDGCVRITEPNCEQQFKRFERYAPVLAGKPFVILLGAKTASAAELLAGAMIENAERQGIPYRTVGKRTRGKATLQAPYDIAPGIVLKLTRGRYLSASGIWYGDGGQTVSAGLDPEIALAIDTGAEGLRAAVLELRENLF